MASKYQLDINTLAWWVFTSKYQGYKGDCPKVGYLGYANGMTNADFRIKVFGRNEDGFELANKFLARAYAGKGDFCVCKLRRGLKVTFYNK